MIITTITNNRIIRVMNIIIQETNLGKDQPGSAGAGVRPQSGRRHASTATQTSRRRQFPTIKEHPFRTLLPLRLILFLLLLFLSLSSSSPWSLRYSSFAPIPIMIFFSFFFPFFNFLLPLPRSSFTLSFLYSIFLLLPPSNITLPSLPLTYQHPAPASL